VSINKSVIEEYVTITEIATSLRPVLKNCVNADKDVPLSERRYAAKGLSTELILARGCVLRETED
jgi:hypothetical protein